MGINLYYIFSGRLKKFALPFAILYYLLRANSYLLMLNLVEKLLKKPQDILLQANTGKMSSNDIFKTFLIIIICSILYGMSVGSFVGGEQILFAGAKMPILFLGTLIVCFLLMYISCAILIKGTTMLSTAQMTLVAICISTIILVGFSPIVWIFSISLPYPSYVSYLFLVMTAVLSVAIGGVVSIVYLYKGLKTDGRSKVARLIFIWFIVYAFVGGQMVWLLRPWVGNSADVEGKFSFARNFRGNIYEAIINALIALFKGG